MFSRVNTFCFYFDLPIAGQIIGWVGIGVQLIFAIFLSNLGVLYHSNLDAVSIVEDNCYCRGKANETDFVDVTDDLRPGELN